MVRITRVGPEFAPELAQLWVATFVQAYSDKHQQADIEAYCERNFTQAQAETELSDGNTTCLVHYRDEQPTGFCIVKHRDCPFLLEGGSSELKQLYVVGSEYGRGVGQLLLRHAYQAARSGGHRWIWLVVAEINHRARSFYEKNGFGPLGVGPILEVGGEKLGSIVMSRDIAA